MKIKTIVPTALTGLALLIGAPAFAQDSHAASTPSATTQEGKGKLVPVTKKDAAWAAQARKDYPLDSCVTSGEKLGSMGDASEFIYRVEGQPDRLVRFCCSGCEEDFLAEPAKYLAKIDNAKKAAPAGHAHGHKGHGHD